MRFVILFILFFTTPVLSGGSSKHWVFPTENKEIVTRLQNCSSNQFTKDIFLQYEKSDGTLEEPDGYVYYFDNIDTQCVKNISSIRYYENISFALKDNQLWYFHIPKLTDPGGINTRFVELNDAMIFIDISVGYTHTRNFIYNTESKTTIFINNGVATLEKDYILIEGNKSYYPNREGAFWQSFKLNYNNEVIEIINAEKSEGPCTKMSCVHCITEEEYLSGEIWIIGDNVREYLEKNKPAEWCVYH
tara:strand:- start:14 stop:754 length:741 start_codon:yes stop_codon:yes gene_type:complete